MIGTGFELVKRKDDMELYEVEKRTAQLLYMKLV